jgi:hypothetical protein
MRRILIRLREETMREFDANCLGQKQEEYRNKVKQLIEEKEASIIEINNNLSEAGNNEILKRLSQKMKTKF